MIPMVFHAAQSKMDPVFLGIHRRGHGHVRRVCPSASCKHYPSEASSQPGCLQYQTLLIVNPAPKPACLHHGRSRTERAFYSIMHRHRERDEVYIKLSVSCRWTD